MANFVLYELVAEVVDEFACEWVEFLVAVGHGADGLVDGFWVLGCGGWWVLG